MLETIAKILITPLIFVLSLAGYNINKTELGATLPIAGQTYTLSGSGISSNATSITLSSLTLPQTGYKIQDSDLSTTFYITLEPGNRTKQEVVSCTTVTQNANNTATLSGCSRGLLPVTPYTASSTYAFAHGGGTSVIFSNPPQFYNQFLAADNTGTITGQYTFSTAPIVPTVTSASTTNAASVEYVNDIAIQGVADAATTVKGASKLSYAPSSSTNPISVGDNDPRVPTQGENDALVGSLGTPSSSNKYLTEQMATTTATSSYLVKYDTNGTINAYSITVSTTTSSATSSVASVAYVDSSRWISYATGTSATTPIPTGANIVYLVISAGENGENMIANATLDSHIGITTSCAVAGGTNLLRGFTATWNTSSSTIGFAGSCDSGVTINSWAASFYK